MAENNAQASTSSSNSDVPQPEQMEVCAICLDSYVYPTELPCKHTFCFLCLKGLSRTTGCCAMCRQQFPVELLNNPYLKEPLNEALMTTAFEDGHQWFYEGRNGWWQYDERTGQEIENAHTRREVTFEILIAGRMYIIDFENMVQFRKSNPIFIRRIKRDVATIPKKGFSGIRLPSKNVQDELLDEDQSTSTNVDQDGGIVGQTPTSNADLQDDLLYLTSSMNLDD